jgi:hypothetical protein
MVNLNPLLKSPTASYASECANDPDMIVLGSCTVRRIVTHSVFDLQV